MKAMPFRFRSGLSLVEAAALPETFFTVWTNLFQRAKLKAGETVLVHGGASGIGTTATMLSKAFGATVAVTVGSEEKGLACLSLGASRAINYRTQDFVEEVKKFTDGKGADVVVDIVGGDYVARNYQAAALNGRIVQIGVQNGPALELNLMTMLSKRLTHTGSTMRSRSVAEKAQIAQELERQVWPLLEQGKIRPQIYRTFQLEHAADAHTLMESGVHIGKIVLIISAMQAGQPLLTCCAVPAAGVIRGWDQAREDVPAKNDYAHQHQTGNQHCFWFRLREQIDRQGNELRKLRVVENSGQSRAGFLNEIHYERPSFQDRGLCYSRSICQKYEKDPFSHGLFSYPAVAGRTCRCRNRLKSVPGSRRMTQSFDLVVIGAGIHGAGIAQAAAARGISVLVLEQAGVASGTSSRSSKLIHGGLRYLESRQFSLVRECLQERALLLKLAPGLVELKPFYIPVYRDTARRPWLLYAGLSLYRMLGGGGPAMRFRRVPKATGKTWTGWIPSVLKPCFSITTRKPTMPR